MMMMMIEVIVLVIAGITIVSTQDQVKIYFKYLKDIQVYLYICY